MKNFLKKKDLSYKNDLYNFDKERYIQVIQEANEAYLQYAQKRKEIMNSIAYTEEEK